MSFKTVAISILRTFFLVLFLLGLFAALYGVKKMDPEGSGKILTEGTKP